MTLGEDCGGGLKEAGGRLEDVGTREPERSLFGFVGVGEGCCTL